MNDISDQEFSTDARNVPWNGIFLMDNLNDKVSFLTNNIIALFDKFAPLRRYKIGKRKIPWIFDSMKYLIRKKNKLF